VEFKKKIKEEVRQALTEREKVGWAEIGRKKEDKETWWWNEEV